MVELVTVVALLGVITAVAFSRFSSTNTYREYATRDGLLASLRLAQQVALSHQASTVRWRLQASGGDWEHTVLIAGNAQDPQILEGGALIGYAIPYTAGAVGLSSDEDDNEQLLVEYDVRGNMTGAGMNAVNAQNNSVQINISGSGSLCISPTGFAYEGACRP